MQLLSGIVEEYRGRFFRQIDCGPDAFRKTSSWAAAVGVLSMRAASSRMLSVMSGLSQRRPRQGEGELQEVTLGTQ